MDDEDLSSRVKGEDGDDISAIVHEPHYGNPVVWISVGTDQVSKSICLSAGAARQLGRKIIEMADFIDAQDQRKRR